MKPFIRIALLLLVASITAQGQLINFPARGDTSSAGRIANRFQLNFVGATPYITPPTGSTIAGSYALLSGTSALSSLAGNLAAGRVSGLSTIATSGSFADLLSKPTTVSGYGINDGVSTGGSYTNPPWLVSIPFSKLTTTPSTRAGYGITDAEPTIAAGSAGQYWTGLKTFAALDKTAVGLPNLVNSLQVINAGGALSQGVGTLAGRPTAGTAGRLYYATDTFTPYYDNGTSWVIEQPAITGDIAIAGGATTATLATVLGTPGQFGSGAASQVTTYDGKGRATAVTTTPITPATINSVAQKIYTLSAATNGTVYTHNLATTYGYTTPTMTAVFLDAAGRPDYNVYVTQTSINSVTLVTPLLAGGGSETATGKLIIYVSQ